MSNEGECKSDGGKRAVDWKTGTFLGTRGTSSNIGIIRIRKKNIRNIPVAGTAVGLSSGPGWYPNVMRKNKIKKKF